MKGDAWVRAHQPLVYVGVKIRLFFAYESYMFELRGCRSITRASREVALYSTAGCVCAQAYVRTLCKGKCSLNVDMFERCVALLRRCGRQKGQLTYLFVDASMHVSTDAQMAASLTHLNL